MTKRIWEDWIPMKQEQKGEKLKVENGKLKGSKLIGGKGFRKMETKIETSVKPETKKIRRNRLDYDSMAKEFIDGDYKNISQYLGSKGKPKAGVYFLKMRKAIEKVSAEGYGDKRDKKETVKNVEKPKRRTYRRRIGEKMKNYEDSDFLDRWFSDNENLSKEEYVVIKKIMKIQNM